MQVKNLVRSAPGPLGGTLSYPSTVPPKHGKWRGAHEARLSGGMKEQGNRQFSFGTSDKRTIKHKAALDVAQSTIVTIARIRWGKVQQTVKYELR